MDEDEENSMKFMRITVLGKKGSGKSSLINVFINHTFNQQYVPTTEPLLYYSTVHMKNEEDDFGVLVEIEDTFPTDSSGMANYNKREGSHYTTCEHGVFYDLWWPSIKEDSRAANSKSDMKNPDGSLSSLTLPLSMYDSSANHGKYRPLTRNRMGYFILFDSCCQDSYKEALSVLGELKAFGVKKTYDLRPVIYLVATKMDADSPDGQQDVVIRSATAFAEQNSVLLKKVSAKEFNGVKKLFRLMTSDILANQPLWLLDKKESVVDDLLNAEGNCSLQ